MNDETRPGARKRDEENVISVWHGSGNEKFFRRRYFDGFTQYETLDEHGNVELHNVYTGVWYIQQLTKEQRSRRRLLYLGLWVPAVAALIFGVTRPVAANIHWYGGVPAFAGLYGLGWIAVGLFNEFTVPQKRTIGDYRASSLSIRRGGLLAMLGSGLIALVSVIHAVLGIQAGAHVLAAGGELLALGLSCAVRVLESRVVYQEKISDDAGRYTM